MSMFVIHFMFSPCSLLKNQYKLKRKKVNIHLPLDSQPTPNVKAKPEDITASILDKRFADAIFVTYKPLFTLVTLTKPERSRVNAY